QRGGRLALGDGGEEAGLDVGGFVHARRNTVGDQIKEEGFFACRRVLQQLDQACGLLGVQRLGHDPLGGTLFYVFAIGFKHSYYPHQWSRWPATLIQKPSHIAPLRFVGALAGVSTVSLKKLLSK